MSKLRSAVVWLVLTTQIWTPVLAQTLPISVDKSVAGQKPVVGVANGVPVVNIAPPSAGGVSNNRFTQFNVGPSGVVLNNSGAASQTQLAGQVAGNPMLGNQRAATILNQVTTANPSRLMGMLEVAGNRANVIVANPAGITCNGCGFLNANRATLTTGKPVIGPDGTLGFDIASGRLAIEGAGLYGANLSQLDLLARTLELNAQVWADRLNVVAGAARVGYDGIDVSALAGDGAGTGVALDVAALGGMYANSIRLIGTEAGVGVNVGGNLAALTGTLSVSANGDVRILPSARVQAARDLSLQSGRDIVNQGTATAGGALAFNAAGKIVNHSAISSGSGASIVARQMENRGAFTAGLQADGSVSPLGTLSVQVDQLLNPGVLVAGGNAAVTAGVLGLSGGKFVAGGALTLDATGAVSNRAGEVYGGSVVLRAASLDNSGGKLASGGALRGRVTGAIDNTGGTLAGAGAVDVTGRSVVNAASGVVSGDNVALRGTDAIDNQGGTVQANGALRVETAGALDNRGGKLLGGSADIQAASVDNRNGVAQADGKLAITSGGVLRNQDGGLYGGTADLKSGSLENGAGRIATDGALDVTVTGAIDNTGGTIAAQGLASLDAQRLTNARGIVAANGLSLETQGVLDNNAGLIQADNALALSAGSLINRDTLVNGVAGAGGTVAGALGMMGKQVTLNAGSIDNQAGRIGAGQDLGVTTGALDNARGNVSSDANAKLAFSSLTNTGGALTAGTSLELVTGNLDNDGKIHSGQDLKITANTLTNRAGGELIAVRNNELVIGGLLANAGLIDGGYTRIHAGSLTNTGRIYGDRIGIQTPVLLNDANAVIASRGDIDLGVGTLTNREHALIYAAGDLRIGGTLDAGGKAAGQATLLANESATIEAERNADIAAASIQNRNLHFASETVEVSREAKWFYRLDGTTDIVDGEGMWFCNTVKSICGRGPSWMGQYDERRLLMPSARYPESQYGPPFDYSNIQNDQEGRAGISAPIGLAYIPSTYECGGGDAGECYSNPAQFLYKPDAKIWSVFQVERPSGLRQPSSSGECDLSCLAQYRHDVELYDTLNEKIKAFNADFRNNRMIKDFTFYEVTEITRETRITQSDPGKIIVGGNARLAGNIVNDKSRILAGGTLKTEGGTLSNVGAEGLRTVDRVGTMAYTYEKNDSRKYNRSDYNATVLAERIETGLGDAQGGASVAPSGQTPGGSTIVQALPPATLTRITLPGNQTIAVVVLPPTIPTSKLYQVVPAPNAPYLIATDSQFIGSRTVVSSDFLLEKLNQDPGHILKRLGDGFYEQKLVAEQVMLASGQRFVGDYTDNETQYKALLSAGADFANQFGLAVGTALTEEQMRHLTSDIVWMVEQTVTLPDGTQQKVLAPQVYLAVKPGDLRGDGTLIAGRDTQISATGDVANSGTIGARNALVVDAQNVRNTVGTIQGKTVNLNARNDIDNLAGLLKGDGVTLTAGRDINLTASTQSNVRGGISNTIVDGVARIDAGTLNAQAGRDVNAQAAAIVTSGDASIRAGNDINLTAAGTSYGESFNFGKKNRSEMRTTEDIGTQIAAGGNLTLMAVRDVNAIAAQVASDKQLAVGAGRDINVLAGDASGYTYNEIYYKTKGFLSSKTTHRIRETEWTKGVSSTFGGDTVAMLAGRDMTVVGSNIVGDRDVEIAVGRDLQVLAKDETYKDYQYEKVKKSGFGGGGFSIGYNKQERTDWMRGASGGYAASTIGSAGGNLTIDAGRDVGVMASNLLAQDGNISIVGSNVAIIAGVGEARQHEYHEFKQSGLTIGVAGGMLGAAQQIQGTLQQAGDAKSGRLAAVKVGQAAYQAVQANRMMDAAKADDASVAQKDAASAQIQISLGSSKSVSETKRTQETAFGSSVMAGGNISIIALGEKGVAGSGNLSIIGSDLAGKNVLLAATNDLMLQSQAQTSTEVSTNKNSGWKVGVGIGVSDSGSGGGINIFASGYVGSGNAKGNGTTYRETQVSARDNLTLISGRDTVLEGAQARADRIRADIGRNLILASQQDSDRYDAKQKQANAGASFSFGSMTGNAYLGASIGKTKSNYDSVIEQTGLFAGSGGYDIYVGKHTQLDGAVIASGADASKNWLSTETLGFSNLHNKAEYKSTTVGINLGMSGAFDKPNKGDALGAGPSGLSFGSTSGSESGTTRAAVSAGTIEVRSDKDTGRDSTAGLSRDTEGANGSIGKIFDKDKVREQLEFQQAFGQLGMQIAGDVTKKLAKDNPDIWGEGKVGKIAVHSIVAAAGAALGGGNVAGAISGTVAGDLASAAFKDAIDEVMSGLPPAIQREVASIALNALAGAAGGLAGGVSGAGAALSADMFNRQLHPDEKELAKKLALEAKNVGYDVTVEQIETQLRRMDVTLLDGETHAGTAAVVIGDDGIFDKATNFVLVGRAEDGRNIWMEVPSPADRQLQEFIVANANARDIPTGLNYRLEPDRTNYWDNFASPGSTVKPSSAASRYCVTAECAAGLARVMSAADYDDRRNQNADVIAYLAKANGRFGAIAGTVGSVPGNPYGGLFLGAAKTADVSSWVLGGLEQMLRPKPIAYATGGVIDVGVHLGSNSMPYGSIIFNEIGEYLKSRYAN
ncbi:hemagglutinin repeat-containing protein [Achromobacter pulmonis]|uniref:hemagglutinin repeat-containing protein n=1 Tax=Achromobacter pulmonis TaxID=1389932 RepID=UPI001F24B7E4|nr:hemagglutinin repeat-containing protein [Achromobacter pulmonis]MCF7767947.1 hemagglutinin repeat-containing protein [Achromobacter pulmonis]